MSEKIKTPRTDAAVIDWVATEESCVYAEFARQLERELALVTQERDALRKKLDEAYERAAQVLGGHKTGYAKEDSIFSVIQFEIRSLKTEDV